MYRYNAVDASYLSPNVNMSARLEAATKQFGVPLLLSEDFVNICSDGLQPQCRQIDRVTVKGSIQPMGIFTFDTNVDEVGLVQILVNPVDPRERGYAKQAFHGGVTCGFRECLFRFA